MISLLLTLTNFFRFIVFLLLTCNIILQTVIYRVPCKKVYYTLKVIIQHFLSTKIIKNVQI